MGDLAGAWGQAAAACATPASGVHSTAWQLRRRQPRLSSRKQVTQNIQWALRRQREGEREKGVQSWGWTGPWTGPKNGQGGSMGG